MSQPDRSLAHHRQSGVFTQTQAQALWDALCMRCYPATLSFRYHEKVIPQEIYQVVVPVGPGSFPADKLREVMEIADHHDAEPHLIGDGLLLLPKREVQF